MSRETPARTKGRPGRYRRHTRSKHTAPLVGHAPNAPVAVAPVAVAVAVAVAPVDVVVVAVVAGGGSVGRRWGRSCGMAVWAARDECGRARVRWERPAVGAFLRHGGVGGEG